MLSGAQPNCTPLKTLDIQLFLRNGFIKTWMHANNNLLKRNSFLSWHVEQTISHDETCQGNEIAKVTNSTAKVMSSIANGMKSIAK